MQARTLSLALEGYADTPSLMLEGVPHGVIVFHPTAVGSRTSCSHTLQNTSGIDLEYEASSVSGFCSSDDR